ncbi:glycoside hydrolase family 127 protein [Microbacterium oryzae]|uniref:glycoside hydrolase family 127 protein n=1 Tax=Microbacterium oryzae TaxID=743009 RepID=UPI0025B19576|nr:beta-L-arabinofuranosidase domain-containing protein [Microbacterium oryzae]MDN3310467.1 glycoside hydrolase family 127 protein [Microbacterium oryzae]
MPADHVTLVGGFWGERQAVNAQMSIRHCLDWMEGTGWIANFDRTARGEGPERAGREFADSEIYKLLEAMAWESARTGGVELEETFVALSRRVLAAQCDDGYLNTRFGGPGQPARYSDLEWGHELYCAGHLIQAGVARARTVGLDDEFVHGVLRVADHVVREFGEGGRDAIDGHPEIEPALSELARVTGDDRYLHQAAIFVERHGRGLLSTGEAEAAYFQDEVPVREGQVFAGHAVRAMYLAAGAIDVAVDTGDDELLQAVERQWEQTLARRTYLTGGMGSRHDWESFGDDFELPSDRAYSETCAAIGSVMVGWRLLLATGEERHADQIERALFNVVAAAPDSSGTAFFYVNPLQRRVPGVPALLDRPSPRAASSQRAPWFEVSCCPTNTARTLASLAGYVASTDDSGIRIHQFAPAEIATTLRDGSPIRLHVTTEYPLDGLVSVEVLDAPDREWTLTLRIPAWAEGTASVDASGEITMSGSAARVRGRLKAGDVVRLTLPVEPRITIPDSRIDAVRGTIAVEAGPLVYCLESVDLPEGADLLTVAVDTSTLPVRNDGDVVTIQAELPDAVHDHTWAYGSTAPDLVRHPLALDLIPYHRWAERGPSTMRVWIPERTGR